MDARRRTALVAVGLCTVLAGCSPAPTPTTSRTPTTSPTPAASSADAEPSVAPELAARLQAALDESLAELGAPGAQAAIAFEDGSVWAGASGQSTPERAMAPELLMPLASVTKLVTATLVLRLADEGVLSLDDEVARWLPDAPNVEGVTIRQLLTHTGGVASDDPALPPVCDPGTCYSYSNGGYQHLGEIIEVATGSTYAAALHERILDPLGLASTFYPREEAATGEQAMGHQLDGEALAVDAAASGDGPGWIGASGGIVSTAEDAVRLAHALFAGEVLSGASLAALTDVEATRGLPGTNDCSSEAMIGRRGSAFGETRSQGGNAGWFRAWLEHYQDHGLSVVVLTNSQAFPASIADRLVAAALEGSPPADPGGTCEAAIAVRSPDGIVRRLPDAVGFDGQPAWSPDGASLAWLALRDGQPDIMIADADGSNSRQLTDDASLEVRVAWSQDGESLVFSSDRDGDHELYRLRLSDGATTRLTDNDVDDWLPTWSPDGASIAYIRTTDANELRILAADGSSDRAVDGPDGGAWWPAWSPDGTRIAFESAGMIFIVPVAGGEPVRLPVERLRVVRLPAWAPSSDLVFSSDGDLYAAAPDGANLRRLTETPTEEITPAWAPDGETLAYQVSYWVP